jgi:hypothetical protein
MLKRIGGTVIQVKEGASIENPRKYESVAVENLRSLLLDGRAAQQDPHRENFYEIDGEAQTYYIHISPVSGNVVLLARWIRQSQDCCANTGQLMA